jgi:hypothetical protein
MKHSKTFLGFLVLLCAAALFLGCPTETEEKTVVLKNLGVGAPRELTTDPIPGGNIVYYSLTTGEVVTGADINSQNWDIAFARASNTMGGGNFIYTNSGVTASGLGSGGDGGVWYTDNNVFTSVSDRDGVPATGEYAGLAKDTTKYTTTAQAGNGTLVTLNVMTYLGYYPDTSGDGNTDTAPYRANPAGGDMTTYLPYTYDKHQFYRMVNMMQSLFEATEEVYIIRHGNGIDYSKIQVTDFGYASATGATFELKYQNFQ